MVVINERATVRQRSDCPVTTLEMDRFENPSGTETLEEKRERQLHHLGQDGLSSNGEGLVLVHCGSGLGLYGWYLKCSGS